VRTNRYVFARRRRGDTELYDIQRDPHELSNLAERRSHADLRQRLGALAERLGDCSGASCR
jgi:hypothetical protein